MIAQAAEADTRRSELAPFCAICGWRKGGVDSWDGHACKCGLTARMVATPVIVPGADADPDAVPQSVSARVIAVLDALADLGGGTLDLFEHRTPGALSVLRVWAGARNLPLVITTFPESAYLEAYRTTKCALGDSHAITVFEFAGLA